VGKAASKDSELIFHPTFSLTHICETNFWFVNGGTAASFEYTVLEISTGIDK